MKHSLRNQQGLCRFGGYGSYHYNESNSLVAGKYSDGEGAQTICIMIMPACCVCAVETLYALDLLSCMLHTRLQQETSHTQLHDISTFAPPMSLAVVKVELTAFAHIYPLYILTWLLLALL